jgi:purine-binding chemotaxis protein CheW
LSTLILFDAIGEEFAIDVLAVGAVVRAAPRRTLPSSVPWLAGVADVRGVLLPVIDLGLRLGRPAAGIDGDLLVLERGGERAALAVDRVRGMQDADVVPAPRGTTDAAAGIAMVGDRLVLVLDVRALVPEPASPPAP